MRERYEPDDALRALIERTIGAAIEVHRRLGPGLLEVNYEEAMCVELTFRQIAYARQVPFKLRYREQPIGELRVDLLVGGCLLLELKAVDQLTGIHTSQVITYLKATRFHIGLLINFNVGVLKDGIKRIVAS